MKVRWAALVLAACGTQGEWSTDAAEVESIDQESLMRRPGDLPGTLECSLAGGDIEIEETCDGLVVTSCTDQRLLLAAYGGGYLWWTALSGTDNLIAVPDEPRGVRISTRTGRESFRLDVLDCRDDDQDGFLVTEDCNDNNAAVNPAASEVCNGADDDCNPLTDEAGTASTSLAGVYTDVTALLTPGFAMTIGEAESLNLCAGTWTGSVTMQTNAAALNGYPDAASVILDANGAQHAVTHAGGGVQFVNDVTLTGALESGDWCESTDVHMKRSVVAGNQGVDAGGMYGRFCGFVLEDTVVHDNSGFNAGGVFLTDGAMNMTRTTFSSNIATDAGGLQLVRSVGDIYSSTFLDNTAFTGGRDLWVVEGSLHVQASDFGPNTSAGDVSAITARYVDPGLGYYVNVRRGAGTYAGAWIDLGQWFDCSVLYGSYFCTVTALP